jgi:hypothetical protein
MVCPLPKTIRQTSIRQLKEPGNQCDGIWERVGDKNEENTRKQPDIRYGEEREVTFGHHAGTIFRMTAKLRNINTSKVYGPFLKTNTKILKFVFGLFQVWTGF